MSSVLEVIGMSPPYSATIPATYAEKAQECVKSAGYLKRLLERDLKPKYGNMYYVMRWLILTPLCRDIVTRQSFLNAIAIVNILGGSTNSVRVKPPA